MNEQYAAKAASLGGNVGRNISNDMLRDAGTTAVQAAVHRALEGQDGALKLLYNIVDVLDGRLGPVLGPATPSAVNKGNECVRACSPLTDRINQNEAAMRSIHDRITALLDRLEV